jgi:hypothetical protein
MEVLRDQIEAVDLDLKKLKLFGRGFTIAQIKGIDTQVSCLLR